MTNTGAFYRGSELQSINLEVDDMTRDDIREYLEVNFIPNTNYKISIETAAGWRSGPIFSNPEGISFPSLLDSDFIEDWEDTNHAIVYFWKNNNTQSQAKASKKAEPAQEPVQPVQPVDPEKPTKKVRQSNGDTIKFFGNKKITVKINNETRTLIPITVKKSKTKKLEQMI
jgi:hypothetical protein